MKSLKTYNMTQKAINILARKPNKSQYVCRAVVRMHDGIDQASPADFDTRQLLAALSSRNDISAQLRAVILAELTR